MEPEIKILEDEVSALIDPEKTDKATIERLMNRIQDMRARTREIQKMEQALQVKNEMWNFIYWLVRKRFENLPDPPEVIIEAPDYVNAYYDFRDNAVHFGGQIKDDLDVIAHTYFHVVLYSYGVLTSFENLETMALIKGLCDYYGCSYNDDPYFAEKFAEVAGMRIPWLRNLTEIVNISQEGLDANKLSLVWSDACW